MSKGKSLWTLGRATGGGDTFILGCLCSELTLTVTCLEYLWELKFPPLDSRWVTLISVNFASHWLWDVARECAYIFQVLVQGLDEVVTRHAFILMYINAAMDTEIQMVNQPTCSNMEMRRKCSYALITSNYPVWSYICFYWFIILATIHTVLWFNPAPVGSVETQVLTYSLAHSRCPTD